MLRYDYPATLLRTAALLLLVPFCCTLPVPAAPPQQHKEHKRDYKREIQELEEQSRLAQVAGDVPAMEKLLAPDYLGISMTGQVNDRTQQLDRMRSRHLVLTKVVISDQKIKVVGAVAIVTSLAQIEGTNDGMPMNGMYRYTRIYRRYPDGTWKVTNFEVTRTRSDDAATSPQQ
jgi:ketosteroid isomerase-like protein